MDDGKRMIETYEVKNTIHLAGGEVVLAEDHTAAEPYMVCDCSWDNPFNVDTYTNLMVSTDYLEVMKEFLDRITLRVEQIEQERHHRGISPVPLTKEDCLPDSHRSDYTNQIIVIQPEKLNPAARTADHQLLLATGGNGCNPEARGTAVFCTNLFTGESMRWERHHIAGIIHPDRMPEWGANRMTALKQAGKITMDLPEGTFAYGGYHFVGYRKFNKWEQKSSLLALSKYLTSDRELGISAYEQWSKVDYSHKAFYEASPDKRIDIFRCLENGKLYIPGENELFIYTEPPHQQKAADKPSLLEKLEAGKKTAAQSNSSPNKTKQKEPER